MTDASLSVNGSTGTSVSAPPNNVPRLRRNAGPTAESLDDVRRALAEERERIGRDLHDSVIQDLYGVGLLLDAALEGVGDPRTAERVRTAIRTLDTTIRRLRAIVFAVSDPDPAVPLAELLTRVVAGRAGQLGFMPDVEVSDHQARLPRAQTAELLQFVSEALANVARHADAGAAHVRLDLTNSGWSLSVQDDGRGFDPAAVTPGLGLSTLQRRAQLLTARLDLDSAPGSGTTVRLSRATIEDATEKDLSTT
jgi:signal transduction histidine kinase